MYVSGYGLKIRLLLLTVTHFLCEFRACITKSVSSVAIDLPIIYDDLCAIREVRPDLGGERLRVS